MGYNHRNDEIRDNIERMRREREAYADALATAEQFNARLSAKSRRATGRQLSPRSLQDITG